MNKFRILLWVEPQTFGDLLEHRLRSEADIEIVCRVSDPVDLLVAVGETGADVVLHTLGPSHEMPEICTHLFWEYPHVAVIAVSPEVEQGFVYRQTISSTPIATDSFHNLLSAIRFAGSAA